MGSCLVNSLTFTVLRIHHFFIFCQENGKYVEWFAEMSKSTFAHFRQTAYFQMNGA